MFERNTIVQAICIFVHILHMLCYLNANWGLTNMLEVYANSIFGGKNINFNNVIFRKPKRRLNLLHHERQQLCNTVSIYNFKCINVEHCVFIHYTFSMQQSRFMSAFRPVVVIFSCFLIFLTSSHFPLLCVRHHPHHPHHLVQASYLPAFQALRANFNCCQ